MVDVSFGAGKVDMLVNTIAGELLEEPSSGDGCRFNDSERWIWCRM